MRCDDLRRRRLDLDLGLASDADRASAAAHRTTCAACRADAEIERALTEGLRRIGGIEPPPIEVGARVGLAIASRPPVLPRAVDPRGLAGALAAALTCLAALGAVLAAAAPSVRRGADALRILAEDLIRPALLIARTVREVVAPTLDPVADPLRTIAHALVDADVVAAGQAIALAAVLACLASSAWVVGREWRRPAPRPTEER